MKPLERNHLFEGEVLTSADFKTDESYFMSQLRLHNRYLHSYGVANGLDVSCDENRRSLIISPGVAIDQLGREIVLPTERLLEVAAGKRSCWYLTIEYWEEPSEFRYGDPGGFSRIAEIPRLSLQQQAPSSLQLVLAEVQVGENQQIQSISYTSRRHAGLNLGFVKFVGAPLTDNGSALIEGIPARPNNGILIKSRFSQFIGSVQVGGHLGIGCSHREADVEVISNRDQLVAIYTDDSSPALIVGRNRVVGVATQKVQDRGEPAIPNERVDRLRVWGGDIRLDEGNDTAQGQIFFADEGTIEADGANHAILFRRTGNVLEFRESGTISLSSGPDFDEGRATMTIVPEGNVGIGTADPDQKLSVDGTIYARAGGFKFPDGSVQVSAAVAFPVGTILNWWSPTPPQGGDPPLPDGFVVCRGQVVQDKASPYYLMALPNFGPGKQKFVLGTHDPNAVGEEGGNDLHEHTFVLLSHRHTLDHIHTAIGKTTTEAVPSLHPSGSDWQSDQLSPKDHQHEIHQTTSGTFPENKTGTTTYYEGQSVVTEVQTTPAAQIPRFMYLLKIMRIK